MHSEVLVRALGVGAKVTPEQGQVAEYRILLGALSEASEVRYGCWSPQRDCLREESTASVGDWRDDMTISKLVLPMLGALALFGCVAKVGQVSTAPQVTDAKQAAHVTVFRDNSLVGAVATLSFFIDGKEVYGLRRGERYSFKLDPGWHGLKYRIGLNECGQKFEFMARGKYTFRLLPTCGIERTDG